MTVMTVAGLQDVTEVERHPQCAGVGVPLLRAPEASHLVVCLPSLTTAIRETIANQCVPVNTTLIAVECLCHPLYHLRRRVPDGWEVVLSPR